jgi:hypothetical protein
MEINGQLSALEVYSSPIYLKVPYPPASAVGGQDFWQLLRS